jgi:ABC-type Fe3+ transport system permease subunit
MGFAFLFETAYLLPLTSVLLLLAVVALAWGARRRRGYAPLVLGSAGAAIVLVAGFVIISVPGTNLGIGVLIAASLWNSWPRRARGGSVASDQSSDSTGSSRSDARP